MSAFKEVMRDIDADELQYEHSTLRRCSFCAGTSDAPLRQCSVCKSVRYCDHKCQLADYKAGHKRECSNFVTPPLTRTFLTRPTGNKTTYPKNPLFARGSHDGVGCWESIIVFGGRTCVVTNPGKAHDITKVQPDLEDITTYEERGGTVAALRVAQDPLCHLPRLAIKNVAGVEFRATDPPQTVLNKAQGIVYLAHGEYVVYHVQFRVGDGNTFTSDVDALVRLRALTLVWQTATDCVSWIKERGVPDVVRLKAAEAIVGPQYVGPPRPDTVVPFDVPAIYAYYLDAFRGGEQTYVESHYGKERTKAIMEQSEQDRWVYSVAAQMQGIADKQAAGDIEVSDVDGQTIQAACDTATAGNGINFSGDRRRLLGLFRRRLRLT
ncbi:hypothetical protein K466DRAFT_593913 [Polyporus arcularius HHB13444]|uniref:MYND-type domain-containing protein n=1 Tax=Polyporus arcularius HHB13444 TaxID=1314778 RepID=A0A5C3PZ49_9APHY|nr:hypothetical protein K466DRAFT_593913 [Polyporus arcularius HHB13444]